MVKWETSTNKSHINCQLIWKTRSPSLLSYLKSDLYNCSVALTTRLVNEDYSAMATSQL